MLKANNNSNKNTQKDLIKSTFEKKKTTTKRNKNIFNIFVPFVCRKSVSGKTRRRGQTTAPFYINTNKLSMKIPQSNFSKFILYHPAGFL